MSFLKQVPENRIGVKISVIIPLYNAQHTIAACLDGVIRSSYKDFEIIVVDDGSTDGSQSIARNYSIHFIQLEGGPYGPGFARNRGSEIAEGEILLFIDSDVVIYPGTLALVADTFNRKPEYSAMFGSYDDEPGDPGFLSQYKNLTHAFIHQKASQEGSTFWAGCGAIKKSIFFQAGGFNEASYPKPSIEDIELGCRLKAVGVQIWVDKQIKVKHLKRWSFRGLVKTDIFNRAIPWTLLILRTKNMPNDLNLSTSQRISAALTAALLLWTALWILQEGVLIFVLLLFALPVTANNWIWRSGKAQISTNNWNIIPISLVTIFCLWIGWIFQMTLILPAIACWLLLALTMPVTKKTRPGFQRILMLLLISSITLSFLTLAFYLPVLYSIPTLFFFCVPIILNRDLYGFLFQRNGLLFAAGAVPMQLFYYFYSIAAFVGGLIIHLWMVFLKPRLSSLKNEQSA